MLPSNLKIYIASFSVDMRKAIDGLSLLVCEQFKNPADGSIYVFMNKSKNKIKILYFDRNGFILLYKRLERGKFHYSKSGCNYYQLEPHQLRWLLDGLDFLALKAHPKLEYDIFC